MRRLALVALVLVAAGAARADDFVVYLEEEGVFLVPAPVPVDGVNAATYLVDPLVNHTRLHFDVAIDPTEAGADVGPLSAATPYRVRLDLADAATGEPLPEGAFVLDGGGSAYYVSDAPVRATLWLAHGANVTWQLRVSALPDPEPV